VNIALEASNSSFRFRIEVDYAEVGAYLYVYDVDGRCVRDYLQDDVQDCKEFAAEEFGIPFSAWTEVREGNESMR